MPLMKSILDKKIQLFDYECINEELDDNKKRRLVAFGKYAGIAGMIDTSSTWSPIAYQWLLHSLSKLSSCVHVRQFR